MEGEQRKGATSGQGKSNQEWTGGEGGAASGKVADVPKDDGGRPTLRLHRLEAKSSRGKLLEREVGRPNTITGDGASREGVSNKTSTKRRRRRGPG